MLERIQGWLRRHAPGQRNSPDTSHLPTPRRPDGQALGEQRLIVLDLETTGLNPARDEVIAIGAVAIDRLAIPLSDQFDLILRRPELDIRETVLIHGIGPEALTRGHETEDALLRLLQWMNGDPILAFHSAFDQRFLEKALRTQIGYSEGHAWMDVAEILPALFPDAEVGKGRLDDWVDHFELQVSARHHAAADAMATAELGLIALHKAQAADITTLARLEEKVRLGRRIRHLQGH